jgi:hypothetical protein
MFAKIYSPKEKEYIKDSFSENLIHQIDLKVLSEEK